MQGMSLERRGVVVIGAGQGGLAIGRCLAEQRQDFTILEAAAEPAAAWRGRWESLRLFTPTRYSSLPGLPFPGDPNGYPGRDDVVAYLSDYATKFDLPVEYDSRVTAIRARPGGGYTLELPDRRYDADAVVVATGPFQVPRVPPIALDLSPQVTQLHSAEYRSPDTLPAGPVLVVGGGNSGFQIAQELSATREVTLAIGSRQAPLPQRLLGRDLFWYLQVTGLIRASADSWIGRRAKGSETLVGMSPRALRRKHGVALRPRALAATGTTVSFADGSVHEPAAVIWATGYEADYTWIDAPVFDDTRLPVHRRGVTSTPGLYFLGLPWQHTRGSALLGWVGDDATYIAERIAAQLPSSPATGVVAATA